MSSSSRLTLAFLQHDPGSAARVLQALDSGDVTEFLGTLPVRIAAPVVNAMIPLAAASCLEAFEPHRAAGVLRELTAHDRATLVRLMQAEPRQAILAELPQTLARRIARSLRYPAWAVGAWIDTEIPVLRDDNLVDEGIRYLRKRSAISHIFLESAADGHYLGAIAIVDLAKTSGATPLGTLPLKRVEPLSNRATLASVQRHPDWDELLALPVVGRRANVLGGLTRKTLLDGLRELQANPARPGRPMTASLVDALLVSAVGLTRLALGRSSDGSTRPLKGDGHGR